MGEIYHRARTVLIWLGPEGRGGDHVMEILRSLKIDDVVTNKDMVITDPKVRDDLVLLLQKEWWSRIWVLQEVAMAKEDPMVGCGHI
jgi:hypothetical protein